MTRVFFTADEHYRHRNIAEYCGRPWKSTAQMEQKLIFEHNRVVGKEDEVFHLGDFAFVSRQDSMRVKSIVEKLNGTHHLILGNHDEIKPFTYVKCGFESVHTAFWFEVDEYSFVLAHDPSIYTVFQNDHETVVLVGHIHNLFQHMLPERRIINVGVDVWDYKPVSLEEILELLREHGIGEE